MSRAVESDSFDQMAPERDMEEVPIAEIGDVLTTDEMRLQPPGTWEGAGQGKWRLVARILEDSEETTQS